MLLYGYFYCQLYERDPSGGKKRSKLHIFLESNRAEETASCDYCLVPPFLLALLISRLLSYVIILQFSLMCWPYSYFLLARKKVLAFSLAWRKCTVFIHLPLFGVFKSMIREEEEE